MFLETFTTHYVPKLAFQMQVPPKVACCIEAKSKWALPRKLAPPLRNETAGKGVPKIKHPELPPENPGNV